MVGTLLGFFFQSPPPTPESIQADAYEDTFKKLCIKPGKDREDAFKAVFGFVELGREILQANPKADWDALKALMSANVSKTEGYIVRTIIQIIRAKAKKSGGETDYKVRQAFIAAALDGMEQAALDAYERPYDPSCKPIDPFSAR